MRTHRTHQTWRLLGAILLAGSILLSACGTTSNTGSGSTTLVIASKNDLDGRLLAQMYALLLEHQGYKVNLKLALGQTPVLFTAIKSGAIDMYPEFTGTALTLLGYPSTQNAQLAFSEVKSAYESKYHITWLSPAYNLNDSYAICTSQAVAQRYHLTSLTDLAPVASQLVVASPQDGLSAAVQPVEKGYNIQFKQVQQITEPLSFGAVNNGSAQLNVCYTTDPSILTNNFVVLQDPRHVFPIYNPAPIVRDSVLQGNPKIATTLNALEPHLTTDVIVQLIKQVGVDHQPIEQVAKSFLQQQGLLPK